jgi:hypothetical protein
MTFQVRPIPATSSGHNQQLVSLAQNRLYTNQIVGLREAINVPNACTIWLG